MDFFVEIGVENFPAKHLDSAIQSIENVLKSFPLTFSVSGTHRRLVIQAKDIKQKEFVDKKDILGPPYEMAFSGDKLNQIGQKFLDKNNLTQYVTREENGKKYLVGISENRQTIEEILIDAIQKALKIPFYTSMTWSGISFLRPIRYITAFLDNNMLQFKIGDITFGDHILLNRERIKIKGYKDYLDKIKDIKLTKEDRTKSIDPSIDRNDVFNEAINTVEQPKVVLCAFDKKYLKLPYEVIRKTIEIHQFGIMDKDKYYIICEKHCEDKLVANGNQTVVNSRLSDAEMFTQADDKYDIATFVSNLSQISFHGILGTMLDKQERLTKLARIYKDRYNLKEHITEAAKISKFDLATSIVKEKDYNDLRGYIAKEYAKSRGVKQEVSEILFGHYLPRFSGDMLPETKESAILSILDKADNIIGCALLDKLPSGAKDPMYIRRDAINIISVIDRYKIDISFKSLFKDVLDTYLGQNHVQQIKGIDKIISSIRSGVVDQFMLSRVESYLSSSYDKSLLNSVISHYDNFIDLKNRLEAISKYDLTTLKNIYTRLEKLVSNKESMLHVDEKLLREKEEKILFANLESISLSESYENILHKIVNMQGIIDNFFDKIIVMVEDKTLRENRVALLTKLFNIVNYVLDMNKLLKG